MKRTALMITLGAVAAMTLGAAMPAGAQGLLWGMPQTNIMQDYYTLLPKLQALQAWGHANGMPYALPGTLGGYSGGGMGSAMGYWGDKFDQEYLRENVPVYENNPGHLTIYGNGDWATGW